MNLAYFNFAAMIIGYITIAVLASIILIFIGFSIRERYNDWKSRKEFKQSAAPVETKPAEKKEAKGAEKTNAQITVN